MPSTVGIVSSSYTTALSWKNEVLNDNPYSWFQLNSTDNTAGTRPYSNYGSVRSSFPLSYYNPNGQTTNFTATGITNLYPQNNALSIGATTSPGDREAYIDIQNFATLQNFRTTNAFSMEFIFSISQSTGRANFGRQKADAGGWGFLLGINGIGNFDAIGWAANIFTYVASGDTGVPWVADQWYHAVYTYSNTASKIYINGNEVLSSTYSAPLLPNDNSGYSGHISSFLGAYDHSSYASYDEMIIYRSTLSAARIAVHADAAGLLDA